MTCAGSRRPPEAITDPLPYPPVGSCEACGWQGQLISVKQGALWQYRVPAHQARQEE